MNNLRRYLYDDLLNEFGPEAYQEHYPRLFYPISNPFEELSNENFINLFRLSKVRVMGIIDTVRQYQPVLYRRSELSVTRKVLIALRFFATGSYQMDIGLNRFCGTSQPSVSRSIHTVIDVFNQAEIMNEHVRFFSSLAELRASRDRFMEEFQFPNAIGCIDCTHVAIFPPNTHDPNFPEHVYVNRKGYHSLNVQLICDADFRIINVNARYPGNTHDSRIWSDSNVQTLMRRIHTRDNERFYLLGDSGYPLREWLMTPFPDPQPDTLEMAFNRPFCRARCMIERVNGILKMRYRCLLKHRVLHYSPTVAAQIVNTCCVLHNMSIEDGFQVRGVDEEVWRNNDEFGIHNDENEDEIDVALVRVNPELAAGRRLRQRIARQIF